MKEIKTLTDVLEYLFQQIIIQYSLPAKYLSDSSNSWAQAKIREKDRQFPTLVKENKKQGEK